MVHMMTRGDLAVAAGMDCGSEERGRIGRFAKRP